MATERQRLRYVEALVDLGRAVTTEAISSAIKDHINFDFEIGRLRIWIDREGREPAVEAIKRSFGCLNRRRTKATGYSRSEALPVSLLKRSAR